MAIYNMFSSSGGADVSKLDRFERRFQWCVFFPAVHTWPGLLRPASDFVLYLGYVQAVCDKVHASVCTWWSCGMLCVCVCVCVCMACGLYRFRTRMDERKAEWAIFPEEWRVPQVS